MQRELALLAEMTTELREIDARLVAMCNNEQQAYKLCIDHSRTYYTRDALAEKLGLDNGHLKQMLNSDRSERKKYMPRFMQEDLQIVCNNKAISQWGDLYRQGMLNCQRTIADEEAALIARLTEIQRSKVI